MKKLSTKNLFVNIKSLVSQSKSELYRVINTTLTETYFHIGRLIVEFEQAGNVRADYATETLKTLSTNLTDEFGRGFSVDNLENMRNFYLVYKEDYNAFILKHQKSETASRKLSPSKSESVIRKSVKEKKSEPLVRKFKGDENANLLPISISETVSRKLETSPFKLTWSHFLLLMRIENKLERKFYEIECYNEKWEVRTLKRHYDSALYERLMLSRNKKKVKELSTKGQVIAKPSDAVKDPYILEFLNLKMQDEFSENDLENAIIHQLEDFLKELGKGFLFVDRQKTIAIDGDYYKVDLVFYHRVLRCFVLIDLKLGTLQHKDLGQLQMYVNYYDEEIKEAEEGKTIGIVLCKNKKENLIKYTLGKNNKNIFASKYKMFFPEKEVLKMLKSYK